MTHKRLTVLLSFLLLTLSVGCHIQRADPSEETSVIISTTDSIPTSGLTDDTSLPSNASASVPSIADVTAQTDDIHNASIPSEETESTTPSSFSAPTEGTAPSLNESSPPTEHQHAYTEHYTPSKCGKWPTYTYTCDCGQTYSTEDRSNAPNDHAYQYVYTPNPDSFWTNIVTATCPDCGDTYQSTAFVKQVDPAILDEIEARTVYWINVLRASEGTASCEAPPVFQQVAEYRAKQLLDDFDHDTAALREACASFQYGEYIAPEGWDAEDCYYTFHGAEAIAKGFTKGTIDETAKSFAELIHGSKEHWNYIGADRYHCIAVGIAVRGSIIVGAIFVSGENYG